MDARAEMVAFDEYEREFKVSSVKELAERDSLNTGTLLEMLILYG